MNICSANGSRSATSRSSRSPPAPIYEEGSLIKRVIRDLYSRDIDEILVDGERGYREAKDYMKMLMPSHAKNVRHYAEPLPLFSRFQVESYLSAMFNPTVQLKSGGYIVIDVTEALVAIDVNSGRATREASIEETALKTNMEAAEEAARQMRLRDLAGLIVIDFIDMDDRRNNASVEKKLKDKLKTDRARIQIGRISGFGLLEMSRQRLRPGMIEATTKACAHCHGTGRVRSDDSMALALLRDVEEEGVRQRSKEVLIIAPVEIANYLLNQKREHVAMIEARFGLSVRVEGDPSLVSPDYRLERFKTASRIIPSPEALNLPAVAYPDEALEEEPDETDEADETEDNAAAGQAISEDRQGGKRKRRRRRRGGSRSNEDSGNGHNDAEPKEDEAQSADIEASSGPGDEQASSERPKSRRRSRGGRSSGAEAESVQTDAASFDAIDAGEDQPSQIVDVPESSDQPRRRERVRKPAPLQPDATPPDAPSAPVVEDTTPAPEAGAPLSEGAETEDVSAAVAEISPPAPASVDFDEQRSPQQPVLEDALADAPGGSAPEQEAESPAPKRRGWWSRATRGN